MYIDDSSRLAHMLSAAKEVQHFVESYSRADLETDVFRARGLIKTLETVGEAASKISRNFRDAHPEISWRDWIDLRNHLSHDYYAYDLDRVWTIASSDIPKLVAALDVVISE